jgi:hypothetical protein
MRNFTIRNGGYEPYGVRSGDKEEELLVDENSIKWMA